jgi:CMP-N-acetylneuraminic acid synthetase
VNICYIQARGGSKRFPGKNLALWRGVPMLGNAIRKAQHTKLFDIILVSSDDAEILRTAHNYGAVPMWRTPENASDTATDTDVAFEVLAAFPDADIVCKLYPCVPLLRPIDIIGAYEDLTHNDLDGVYSVGREFGDDAGAFYIFRRSAFEEYESLALNAFPWSTYELDLYQDINTPEDLEEAKKKAGR